MTQRVHRLLMAALAFFLATSAVVLPGIAAGAIELPREVEAPAPNPDVDDPALNPDLERACGLNILMILDESTSVANANAEDAVRAAFKAFTSALKNTASSMAVAQFATVADLPAIGAFPAGEYITITDATKVDLDNYVDTGYNPTRFPIKYTNWEDGLRMGNPNFAVRPDPTVPHLTVFITDGDPNRIIRSSVSTFDYRNKVPLDTGDLNNANENTAANSAIANANGLKAQGSHILAIAVGDGIGDAASLDRLQLVSGPDIFDGTGAPFDIVTDDIYVEPNFDELEDALREAAFQLCAPSITIQKIVDDTPDPDSLDDAYPGVDWEIEGTPTASGGFEWVLPSNGTGPSTPPSKTTLTDGAGFATFQWNTPLPVTSGFTATEVVQPGYANDQSRTVCTFRTPDSPDADLPLDTLGDGTFSVTIPPESIVTCTIVNIAEPAPGITLEKATNGADADVPEGPRIPVGDPVDWTYVVTNTGNTVLNDISLVDSEVLPAAAAGPVATCPSTTLVQGESMTCTATGTSGMLAGGGDFPGQYGNNAVVTAIDSTGIEVDATDPSHYFVAAPGIDVEKSTNGVDADPAPGPFVTPGSTVTWQYVITNTGTEELNEITLVDSIEGDILAPGKANCVWEHESGGPLHEGETATCDLVGTAITGQYENIVTTTGLDPDAVLVSDSDPSHYFGATTGIAIEKATNGQDADLPYPDSDVPVVEIGSVVSWTYVVTNTGNVPLDSWAVVDDQVGTVACPKIVLLPGASATCSATGTAVAGPYENLGTVTAPDPLGGSDLTASDPSHYFAPTEAIEIEKATNTEDADSPTGPFVPVGDTVEWTYVVTNTGTSTLTDVTVGDNVLGDITDKCIPAGDTPPWDQELAPGETAVCTVSGSAVADQYRNFGLVIGTGPFNDVGWLDPSHYFGTVSNIIINKYTNGSDADAAPGIYVPVGDPIEWTYNVANVGNNTLSVIEVTDDLEGAIACDFDTLPVGEQGVCTLDGGPAILGQYSNVGSVTAFDAGEVPVDDDDPSNYFGYLSAIDVEKATNGQDADLPTGPSIPVGDNVTWTYVVTNPGNIPLSDIVLTDDQGVTPVYVDGDTNGDTYLDPNETWTYEATGVAVEGQYANIATVTGLDLFQDEATDSDPSHYFGVMSAIDIEKATNGQDADLPTGPLVPVGDPVTWTYVVTNPGNVPIANVTVADDQGVTPVYVDGDTNTDDLLDPDETWTYEAMGVAVEGQYANVATASGVDPLELPVEATDPSHYFGVVSAIDVEKATNGQDADTPTGPLVPVGEPVTWTYVVTNPGNVPIANVTVADDQGVTPVFVDGDTSGDGLLDPDETWTYEATGVAVEGQYANVATATGLDPFQLPVEATDPSHYFGMVSGIDIEKATNGQDADIPTGPLVPVGDTVTWTYVVTNPGNVPIANVTVADDQGVVPVYLDGDTNTDDLLDPDETWTYEATGVAVEGQYANVATATGLDPLELPVEATDPSHYFGVASAIDIEKATNGVDADIPTGPLVPVGDPVTWTYVVTNPGNVPLSNIKVTDNQGVVPVYVDGDANGDDLLDPDEAWTYVATGVAVEGQYANAGRATGVDPLETTVAARDLSHYFGMVSVIDVEKATNGQDADTPAGPLVPVGDPVTWTYVVTNPGNVPLANIVVADDQGVVPVYVDGDANGDDLLDPDETWTYEATGVAVEGQYANVATATGLDPLEQPVEDTDPSHYFGMVSVIDIEKATNGVDADIPTGPLVPVGDPVTWTYVVTNPGNVPIANVTVVDDQGVVPVYLDGDANGDDLLDPDETWTYEATGVAVEGQYANVATATGLDPLEQPVEATDPSHYFGVVSDIVIEKATNGEDADIPTGPLVPVGDPVTWTYVVSNPGNVPLANIVVADDQGVVPVYVDGDANGDDLLDPDETWTYEATGVAVEGQYANVATATGLDTFEQTLEATDPSHYFGFVSDILIEKATNGEDADTPTGPLVPIGDPVTWTYVVSNPGNVPLANIVVTDDQGVVPVYVDGDANSDDLLDPDETWTYEASGTAVAGQYANIGSVTGLDPLEQTLEATDPSHYLGFGAGIDIEKATNGDDADLPTGPQITVGDPVTWTYVVMNTGDVPLSAITLVDDQGVVPVFLDGDANGDGLLDPDETWTYEATGIAIVGQYTNVGTVSGVVTAPEDPTAAMTFAIGDTITDQDPSNYFGFLAGIDVEKATNGQDADVAPGVDILVGDPVTWMYVVTNTGDVPLANIVLVDDQGEVPIFIGGDTNGDALLDPDEIWTFEATGTATGGQYTNVATATGTDPEENTVTDEDPSNYNGVTEELPNTGIDTDVMLAFALLLLAAGALLVGLTRSRSRKPDAT